MTNTRQLLLEAAKFGNTPEVQRLVQNADINDTFEPLIQAAQGGHLECVKLLVDTSKYLNNDALCAAAKNGHAQCVEHLIPISLPHDMQNRALREACYHGHVECVQLLIPVSDFGEHNDPAGALGAAVVGGHHDCMEAVYDLCNAEQELNNMKKQYTEELWGMLDQYHQRRLSDQQKSVLMDHVAASTVQRIKKM